MKIMVCIKQVPDTETKLKLSADGKSVDEAGFKWIVNPYDEYAIEEALKLKEANPGSQVTVFSLGPKARTVDAIRTALAMGADEGVVINSTEILDPVQTARALAEAIKKDGGFDLVFTGKLAIDDNASSVSQMIAEFLGVPHATVVSKLTATDGNYTVERESDGGTREILQIKGPAVLAANKGLNTPRYASLPGIMKAKKKPLKEYELSALGIDTGAQRTRYTDYRLPPEKPPVKMISGDVKSQVSELVKMLRDEAKVL